MKKIFLVDDEEEMLEIYSDILTLKGYKIIEMAINGKEAVEKFIGLSEKPDLMIMDQRMPKKSGIQATREILEIDCEARTLFVSADEKHEEGAIAADAICFIKKPFDFNELLEVIGDSLEPPVDLDVPTRFYEVDKV